MLKFGASEGICWLNGGWVMVVGCWLLSVDDVLKFGASGGTCWLNGCWVMVVGC